MNATPATAGYLGSTSYLSVFNQHDGDVDIMHRDFNANIRGGSQSTQAPPRVSATIKEGAEVLSVLISMSHFSTGLERWYKRERLSLVIPFVRKSIRFVDQGSRSGSPDALIELAHRIALRTAQPSAFHLDHTLQAFADGLTGNGLCWKS